MYVTGMLTVTQRHSMQKPFILFSMFSLLYIPRRLYQIIYEIATKIVPNALTLNAMVEILIFQMALITLQQALWSSENGEISSFSQIKICWVAMYWHLQCGWNNGIHLFCIRLSQATKFCGATNVDQILIHALFQWNGTMRRFVCIGIRLCVCVGCFFFMWIDSNEMKCKTQCNAMQYKTHDVLRWNGVDVAALRCHWCWWWYDDATDHGLHWSFTCSSTVSLDCSCAHL